MNPSSKFSLRVLPHGETTLRANEENETFHVGLGYRESQLLYVEQWGLDDKWGKTHQLKPLVIWDIGLGAAFNSGAVLESWKKATNGHLHLISFDKTLEPLEVALHSHLKDQTYFPHLKGYPWDNILIDKGYKCVDKNKTLRWDWILGDFTHWVHSHEAKKIPAPDLILFDAYSPQKNWEMWKLDIFKALYHLSKNKDCQLSTYSRATGLRTTLLLAGFYVGFGCALGNKEDTTVASTKLELLARPLQKKWVETVRKSHKGQPHVGKEAGFLTIEEDYLREIENHPQFTGQE